MVVALLWWIVSSLVGGGDDTETTAETSTSAPLEPTSDSSEVPSESEDASASESESEAESSESAAPSESEEPEESESEEADALANQTTCDVDDLQLKVRPGENTFSGDQQPNFFLTVTNPTGGDCEIDLSEEELKFEVFTLGSSYDRVWGDTDCNRPTSSSSLDLEAGDSRTYEMTAWSRTTSAPDSCDNREPVGAGAYMVYGHIGDNTSEPQTFNLA